LTRVVIRNVAQLKAFNKKLRSVSAILPRLQTKALENASADTILNDIHRDMRANQFSEKIIDATFVGPIEQSRNGARIHFISDYVSESGFDVSNAREEGTKSGITRRANNPKGALKIPQTAGGFVFRKSSTPKGIERLLIIENNISKSKQLFQDSYGSNIASSINSMVKT